MSGLKTEYTALNELMHHNFENVIKLEGIYMKYEDSRVRMGLLFSPLARGTLSEEFERADNNGIPRNIIKRYLR